MSGKREADVVVIGAGAAGLAAASAARAGGLDVVLLEAKDRIGGRALTDATSLSSGAYDIGCHWLHDASENPFAAIALTTGRRIRNTLHPGRMPRWLAIGGVVQGERQVAVHHERALAPRGLQPDAGELHLGQDDRCGDLPSLGAFEQDLAGGEAFEAALAGFDHRGVGRPAPTARHVRHPLGLSLGRHRGGGDQSQCQREAERARRHRSPV